MSICTSVQIIIYKYPLVGKKKKECILKVISLHDYYLKCMYLALTFVVHVHVHFIPCTLVLCIKHPLRVIVDHNCIYILLL